MSWTDLLPYLASAGAAFGGAWLAAYFGLRRFYREKVWERKAAAYTAIFEALHGMEQWYSKHLDAYFDQREVAPEDNEKLTASFKIAETNLRLRLAGETWLIPEGSRDLLDNLTTRIHARGEDWFDHIDSGYSLIRDTTDQLRQRVHADMKMAPWWQGRLARLTRALCARFTRPPPSP